MVFWFFRVRNTSAKFRVPIVQTWASANLTEGSEQHPLRAWAWTFWELDVKCPDLPEGSTIELCCKATDSSYNVSE